MREPNPPWVVRSKHQLSQVGRPQLYALAAGKPASESYEYVDGSSGSPDLDRPLPALPGLPISQPNCKFGQAIASLPPNPCTPPPNRPIVHRGDSSPKCKSVDGSQCPSLMGSTVISIEMSQRRVFTSAPAMQDRLFSVVRQARSNPFSFTSFYYFPDPILVFGPFPTHAWYQPTRGMLYSQLPMLVGCRLV